MNLTARHISFLVQWGCVQHRAREGVVVGMNQHCQRVFFEERYLPVLKKIEKGEPVTLDKDDLDELKRLDILDDELQITEHGYKTMRFYDINAER